MIDLENIDAMIFDCDGVLVDSEVLAIRGERAALADHGLHYTPEEYVSRFVGLHDDKFFNELRADHVARHNSDAPDNFEEDILAGRRREAHKLTSIEGAARAIEMASAMFNAVAVASSSRADLLDRKLQKTDLFGLVSPHIYSADLVENGKPAPDIFLYAAEKLNVDPARCLVLEDSRHGVAGALAAGMTAWGFTGGGHCFNDYGANLSLAGASTVVPNYNAFCDALSVR